MTSDAKNALALDLAQTTTMDFRTAAYLVDQAIDAQVHGRRLIEDDRVGPFIRAWWEAGNAGVILGPFGAWLDVLRQSNAILGDAVTGGMKIRIVKDKGGPHGDG